MTKLIAGIRPYFHVVMIGIFYLISGVWEVCLGAVQGQYFSGYNPLLNFYRGYLGMLGMITIIIGILLFFRVNFARIIAIILAWSNLFIAPAFWFIWHICIEKMPSDSVSFPQWLIYSIVLISILSLIRIYIIRILSISRAGYIFIKKKAVSK